MVTIAGNWLKKKKKKNFNQVNFKMYLVLFNIRQFMNWVGSHLATKGLPRW